MFLRKYRPEDCAEIADLFYHTVHTVNAKDYTQEQLDVWATGTIDLEKWNKSFLEHITIVAIQSGRIVGFGDITKKGYLDRLYVHKDCQNQGAATLICKELMKRADAERIETHASITARPFFEHLGFETVKEQQVERGKIYLTNYVMEKINFR